MTSDIPVSAVGQFTVGAKLDLPNQFAVGARIDFPDHEPLRVVAVKETKNTLTVEPWRDRKRQ